MATKDISKFATLKQLQALYQERHGNSVVAANGNEYNTDSIRERMAEIAIKQADKMAIEREAYEMDPMNAPYPALWDNDSMIDQINDEMQQASEAAHIYEIDYDLTMHNELNKLAKSDYEFKFKKTIWNELNSDSKLYWAMCQF